jgi:hypothetical protein
VRELVPVCAPAGFSKTAGGRPRRQGAAAKTWEIPSAFVAFRVSQARVTGGMAVAVLRLDRFTIGPAETGEPLTRHAALVAAVAGRRVASPEVPVS